MRSLLARVTFTVFATTAFIVIVLVVVVNYQVSENFNSYLGMSGMHSMIHGSMAAMMGAPERQFLLSLRHSLVLVTALMLLVGLGISYYLARSIAFPVIALNRAVKEVTSGNLEATVDVRREDEIGQLTAAFNEMTTKLKSNTVLRQRFLAGIAHELRTPLTILKANLEGIEDGLIIPDEKQMHSLTEEIDRITKLVGELRDLSLLEAGQLTPDLTEVDLPSLLHQIIKNSTPFATEKALPINLKLDTNLQSITADASMLRQIIYNLIMNAIRYTAEGNITVSAERVNNTVRIEVIDTGIGIGDEDIENVFDYFYRVDPARTKQSGGTGLGLALVKQMVLAHGGQVYVKSVLGQGSTFTLILPLNLHQNHIVSP